MPTRDEVDEKVQGAYLKMLNEDEVNEELPLRYAGYHLKDNVLDDITVDELQTMLVSNIPKEKMTPQTAMKEFDGLLKMKITDAKNIVKRVIPEMVKVLSKNMKGE